ncbi:MAG: ClbS/DfsB family four-helix bundle protein [Chloroflexi bacterium]|nr:ClbS/DfsB family four-helix bundle protein [Chloroflexota bacterium]
MTNQDVILSLKNSFNEFTKTIVLLSNEKFTSPMHGWSPKGVVSHLAGWNSFMIEASLSILAGKTPAYYDDAPNNYSNINAGFVAKYSSYSKEELLTELKSSIESLESFILALPQEELIASHNVHHYNGSPATVNKIIESLTGDYQYHIHEIKEWLSEK